MSDPSITEFEIEEMIDLRNRAAQAYYEGSDPVMTDSEFDKLLENLKENGVDEVPGHGYVPVVEKTEEDDADAPVLPKVVHEYKMQSLKKVHDSSDIEKWVRNLEAPKGSEFMVQPKYDGFALDIIYDETGEFIQAATRGNHTVGEDVTVSVRAMMNAGRLPDKIDANGHKGNTHVRGEVYILNDDFIELNKVSAEDGGRTYELMRNTAPGLVRRTDTSYVRFLSFVAYDTNNYGENEVEFLDGNGFITPKEHHFVIVKTLDEIMEAVDTIGIKRFSEFDFEIDGAVVKLRAPHNDRENIGATSTYPRWAVAYKYPEVPVSTVIRSVEWNHNRTGKITPVSIFDTIPLLGTKTSRATLANYAKFSQFGFRPGDHILVIRANGVIPFIVGLDPKFARSDEPAFEHPKFMPNEDFPTRLSDTGKDLLAHVDAPPPLDSIIENAVKSLELKGVGISFIEEMIEAGRIHNFIDMLSITHDELVEMRGTVLKPGETSRSAENTVAAIQSAFDKPLWHWIAAIGMRFVASNKSPILEAHYASLDELSEAKVSELSKLDKFGGTVHANTVVQNSAVIKEWADRLRNEFDFVPKPNKVAEIKESTGSIDYNGKKVVVTGTFPTLSRKEVENWVKEHGGSIGSGVSGSTDILIYGEKAGSKLAKAESLGTQLVTAEIFEQENVT